MRALTVAFAFGLCFAAAACTSHPKAPAGRWEGTFETQDTMVAARLEVAADGSVRISAPDALGIQTNDANERATIRASLAQDLAAHWDAVTPRPMDFDGKTFRKPGGIAPQIEWNAHNNVMVLVVYFGTAPAIRIPLKPVKDFSDDPWPS